MVAGPDKNDGLHDVRSNYNYTVQHLWLCQVKGKVALTRIPYSIFYAIPPLPPYLDTGTLGRSSDL
jgi:hypothetical protein